MTLLTLHGVSRTMPVDFPASAKQMPIIRQYDSLQGMAYRCDDQHPVSALVIVPRAAEAKTRVCRASLEFAIGSIINWEYEKPWHWETCSGRNTANETKMRCFLDYTDEYARCWALGG